MEPATYKCCRCGSPLQNTGEPEQPWPCADGCGEWLTPEAVDAQLFPAVLRPLGTEPHQDAPRCASCGVAMQTLHGGDPYHLCSGHGIWFDKGDLESFMRVLEAEIARHRQARMQREARPVDPSSPLQ
jgi:Zn-finger nucleic acid-binding protein